MRHFDVGEDVRLVCEDGFEGFASVGRFGDDGYIAFNFKQGSECSEDHALVFGENYADGFAAVFIVSLSITTLSIIALSVTLPVAVAIGLSTALDMRDSISAFAFCAISFSGA